MKDQVDDRELERLEQELNAVSGQLAARRDWDEVSAGIRRQLQKPYWDLAFWTLVVVVHALWGLREPKALFVAGGLAAFVLPAQLLAAKRRRERIAENDHELFAECATEIRERFAKEVMVLIFGFPAAIALMVLAFALPDAAWPIPLAVLLTLYLPLHFRFRMRSTAREWSEAERWQRTSADSLTIDPEEEEEEDDEEDESGLQLASSLVLQFFWVFVLYLGPPLFLVMLVVAYKLDDPTRPLIAAGVLVALWVFVWKFIVTEDAEA